MFFWWCWRFIFQKNKVNQQCREKEDDHVPNCPHEWHSRLLQIMFDFVSTSTHDQRVFTINKSCKYSYDRLELVHPGRLTWNLQINHLERKMIFQTSMIMFHVNPPGCTFRNIHFGAPKKKWDHHSNSNSPLGGFLFATPRDVCGTLHLAFFTPQGLEGGCHEGGFFGMEVIYRQSIQVIFLFRDVWNAYFSSNGALRIDPFQRKLGPWLQLFGKKALWRPVFPRNLQQDPLNGPLNPSI